MIFSSITFLYYFLPICLLTYYITPKKYRNFVLVVFSLLFYFYGEPKYVFLLIFACIINYIWGLLIDKYHKKSLLVSGIIINLSFIFYFKYMNFFIHNFNLLFNMNINLLNIILPIGISFFTFQNISYIIDVYKKNIKVENSLLTYMTYITLFPQLIAGPIVRYSDVKEQLTTRTYSYEKFASGVQRFTIGLSKKVLIANNIGQLSTILSTSASSVLSYWLIAISFTLQIYFDFSGYSDMAIGLGKMLGFEFIENFNYPYIARSITDFWRRWHISLSSWLRDYIYIPLGGNRVTTLKWIRNIVIVWFCTGFWHGADWNFIIWGLYFAVLLVFEKKVFNKFLDKHKLFGHIYTILLVVISFSIFNNQDLNALSLTLKGMFGLGNIPFINAEFIYYFSSYFILIIISVLASTPICKVLVTKFRKNKKVEKIISILEPIIYLILLLLVTIYLVGSSFNPFLYFNF